MKVIRILAFQGTGAKAAYLLNPDNDLLLYVGHLGHEFVSDERGVIYGFHPTHEIIESEGGARAVRMKLKRHEPITGMIQNDTIIFRRAVELQQRHSSALGDRLAVHALAIEFDDQDYDLIRAEYLKCYNTGKAMPYGWPPIAPETPYDNCVTVQRRFGMPLIQFDWHRGEMSYFMQLLRQYGQRWTLDDQ